MDKLINTLLTLMVEMWDENMRHRESIRILKTQLQDANRKLAAMGMRSLCQQDWELLEEERQSQLEQDREDYQASKAIDWDNTRKDALDTGIQ